MSTIHCPECDHPIELPADLIAAGVAKLRCPACGAVLRILPGGVVLTLSVGGTGSTGVGGTGGSSGGYSSPSPSTGGGYGGGLNLSVAGPPPGGASGGSPVPQSGGGAGFSYPELEVGTVFRDKWRIEGELGRGGTAVVYRAWDLDADLPVALKVVGVVDGDADALRSSWAAEYKSRRKVADGRYLLGVESPVMEEHEGVTYVALPQELGKKTLREWLSEMKDDEAGRREEGLRLFGEICRGVGALHEAGIAHLDLKPENVLLVESGGGRDKGFIAKVGDFGLARAGGSVGRREGAGTPAYMSPEQVRSAREKEIGPWSDIYSLGCILFEILDGDPPFSGTQEEMKRKHLEMEPPELSESVPANLAQLSLDCMAKTRKGRPESAKQVILRMQLRPEEEAAFNKASELNTEQGWREFLDQWEKSYYGKRAERRLEALVQAREEATRQKRKTEANAMVKALIDRLQKHNLSSVSAKNEYNELVGIADEKLLSKAKNLIDALEEEEGAERRLKVEEKRKREANANSQLEVLLSHLEGRQLSSSSAQQKYDSLTDDADKSLLAKVQKLIDELRKEEEAERKRKAEQARKADVERKQKAEAARKREAEEERQRKAEAERKRIADANAKLKDLMDRLNAGKVGSYSAKKEYDNLLGVADSGELSWAKTLIDILERKEKEKEDLDYKKWKLKSGIKELCVRILVGLALILYLPICFFALSYFEIGPSHFKIILIALGAIVVGASLCYAYLAYIGGDYRLLYMRSRQGFWAKWAIGICYSALIPLLILPVTYFIPNANQLSVAAVVSGSFLLASVVWYLYLAFDDGDFLFWKMVNSCRRKAIFALSMGIISTIALTLTVSDGNADVSSATLASESDALSLTTAFSSIKESFLSFQEAETWKKMFTPSYYTKDAPALGVLNQSLVCFIAIVFAFGAVAISQGDSIFPAAFTISIPIFAGIFLLAAVSLLFEPVGYLQAVKILLSSVTVFVIITMIVGLSND